MAAPTSLIMHAPLATSAGLAVGSGTPTFARLSLGTFIDSGILETAEINEARFEAESYLNEEDRINKCFWSEDMSSGRWVWSGAASAATDGTKGPDGITDAFLVSWTTASKPNNVACLTIPAFTGAVSPSFFFREGATDEIEVTLFESSGINVDFNLNTATGVASGIDSGITNIVTTELANGWWRCTFKVAGLLSAGAYQLRFSGLVDAVGSSYIFGGQVEEADFALSYIKTVGATGTRAEDQLGYDAANWPTLDTAFSIAVDIENLSDGALSGTVVSPIGATGTNDLGVDASDQFRFRYGGVTSTDVVTSTIAGVTRVIATWDTATNQDLYADTVLRDTDATVDAGGTVTEIRVGRLGAASNNFSGRIKNLRIYSTALTQEEIDDELLAGARKLISSIPQSMIGSMIGSIIN